MNEAMRQQVGELPRMGLRERKKLLAQATIADAALQLFRERGYVETSIQDIADAVIMSPRTFFRYFVSKEEVLFASTQVVFDAAVTFLQDTPPTEPLVSALYATFAHLATLYQQQSAHFLAVYQVTKTTPALVPGYLYCLSTLELALCEELTKHEETSFSERQNMLLVATAVAALRIALYLWLENGTDGDIVSLVHEHLQILLDGRLLSRDPRNEF